MPKATSSLTAPPTCAEYEPVKFALPSVAVHGDAHQSNLIQRLDGIMLLIDFERFAFGSPESDLAVTATEYLIGWHKHATLPTAAGSRTGRDRLRTSHGRHRSQGYPAHGVHRRCLHMLDLPQGRHGQIGCNDLGRACRPLDVRCRRTA